MTIRKTEASSIAKNVSLPSEVKKPAAAENAVTTAAVQPVAETDAPATHALAEGLVKAKDAVAHGEVVKTKNQIEEYRLQGQTGHAVSKSEFTPHFKAAKLVGAELKNAIDAHLAENQPAAKAAIDAVGPLVVDLVNKTAAELAKDPEAMSRVAGIVGKVGKEGVVEAMKKAAPDVAKAFTAATGVSMMDPAVVKVVLEGFPKLAEKVAPELAKGLTKTCATVGSKLGVTVAKEGAAAVAKSVGKVAAKQGTEVAAKTGLKVAAAGGKAVPGLGNVISVGSACLAATGLVKELATNPRDGEKIAKTGLNTLLQAVGIGFPWAALAGDVVDIGWSAKLAVTDAKKGKPSDSGLSKQDAAGLVAGPARLLASTLEGAGQSGTAKTFKGLAEATEKAASAGVLERHQVDALSQFASYAGDEVAKVAAGEGNAATKGALESVAHGFGELFKVLHQHKKLGGTDGAKRDDLKANLLRITGDIALGSASLVAGGKGATVA